MNKCRCNNNACTKLAQANEDDVISSDGRQPLRDDGNGDTDPRSYEYNEREPADVKTIT